MNSPWHSTIDVIYQSRARNFKADRTIVTESRQILGDGW